MYKPSKPPDPIEIDKFLGINEAVGETESTLGESTKQVNWRITQNYKPQKRPGHKTFINYENSLDVQGMWSGSIDNKNVLISCNDGKVYEYNFDLATNTEIGTMTDAKTTVYYFEGKLYFLNGFEYKEYDGKTFQDVDPYIPTIAIGSPPAGGGTPFEPINLLTGRKKQEFVGDGVTGTYQLAETNIDADEVYAWVNGARKIENDTFNVVRTSGQVNFDVDPSDEALVIIEWSKKEADLVINDCETVWNEYVNPNVVSTVSTDYKALGTYSEKIRISSLAHANEILVTSSLSSTDLREYTHIRLWLRPTIAIKAGELQLLLDDNVGCVSPKEILNIPALAKASQFITIPLSNPLNDTDIISIGIKQVRDLGDFTLYVDDVRAVKLTSANTNKDLVVKNKYAMMFGPGNDTAVFLWGNPDEKNRRMWSGTLKANYFPAINFRNAGTDETAITDIKTQYDRQIILKEDRSFYSYPEWNETASAWDYPIHDLNEKVGNEAFNAVQIIKNNPVSIAKGSWWEWTSTNIEDERNANIISERLRQSLSSIDLTQAITFDNQREKEYWCNVGDKVYIWNYGNNTIYIYDNVSGTCFLDINGQIYYGSQGTIERFEGLNDNGVAITAKLELAFTDFGVSHLLKNTRKIWVTIQPDTKTSLDVMYTTDKKFLSDIKSINVSFALLDFGVLDFENFSFMTNRAPQPFRKKIRAKKYAYIKFILKNDKVDESAVILSIKAEADTTSEVK
ncbi:hypothetical protein [Desulfosporosinus hippei]|uniref:Uncharacterized protein n=1 Tax=Desulfosporosinus hippei DSM 8344 TaxID=1121419 RepID=A0A1G7UIX4_9FIRM|nr:hypothetical protein [Desulfosporosinus hippei]SDG47463.1 hypothetical protein SAMN05443529_103158 [Desulfosporosinus hippei DSM 8344]